MDAHLPEWLWPIALLTGLGVFIDFLLGRAGQARTRRLLEEWWIRFDDVRWGNFGQREAFFATAVFDRWCGRGIFSVKRWVFVLTFFVIFVIFGYLVSIIVFRQVTLPVWSTKNETWYVLISGLGLATSISLTSRLSFGVARLTPSSILGNLLFWLLLLAVTYTFLVYWTPIVHIFTGFLVYALKRVLNFQFDAISRKTFYVGTMFFWKYWVPSQISLSDLFPVHLFNKMVNGYRNAFQVRSSLYLIPDFVTLSAGYAANLVRLGIAIVFLASFLFQPLIQRPLSLIWLRVVESEKPIFTLVFGGVASIATAASQVAKHLS